MLQLTIEEYQQILAQRTALKYYIRKDFDKAKDRDYLEAIIESAIELGMSQDFINEMKNDLSVKP
jgi:hypothetical protein